MIDWWGPVINESYASSETGYVTLLDRDEALRSPARPAAPVPGVR